MQTLSTYDAAICQWQQKQTVRSTYHSSDFTVYYYHYCRV